MGRVHKFLGLTVGCILANMTPAAAPRAVRCDITYGTNNEFGFDYLRDNMAWSKDELVQRGHNFAIVDEVDSILVDEARTPLIISGPADQATKWYSDFAKLVTRLKQRRGRATRSRASRRPATTRSTRRSAPSPSTRPASPRSRTGWASTTSTSR